MSDSDLQKLLEEEAALREKLAALEAEKKRLREEERARRQEEEERRKMEKPITVTVTKLTGGGIILSHEFREDILAIFRDTPGRAFRGRDVQGLGMDFVPLAELDRALARLGERPNVSIQWAPGVREEIDWFLHAPPLEVVMHPNGRLLLIKPGPRGLSGTLHNAVNTIPSIAYEWEHRSWVLPTTEGWRLFEVVKDIEGVVWDEEAQRVVMEDVEKRARMDLIARKKDSEVVRELNGNELRPFQRVGVEFILSSGVRTLLGDQTGLGKTWQAIAVAEYKRRERQKEIEEATGDPPPTWQTVIVCKASNVPNWIREVKRLTGEEPVVCHGGKPDVVVLMKMVNERAPYIIINYETVASRMTEVVATEGGEPKEIEHYTWVGVLKATGPDFLVVDEAHYIKNPDAYRSKGVRMLADIPHVLPMTASPILNRTEELWPILFLLDPQMFKSQEAFIRDYTWGGKAPRNVKELHEMLKPRFLRRLKKDVQPDLPPINRITHYVTLSDRAQGLYDDALAGIWNLIAEYDPQAQERGQTKIMSILAQIVRLKQICAADKVDFTADLATELQDANENGGKVLIFTQFKGTAVAIAQRLGGEAICTVHRTRNDFVSMDATERDRVFEEARHDPGVKYIVTTSAAQEGHNLEFCNWVIFNDPLWTPEAHNQCEGRAYGRLADPHAIDSYYIIADVEIERWIMELLGKKLAIIQTAVEGVEVARDTDISVAMELIKRMKAEMWRKG